MATMMPNSHARVYVFGDQTYDVGDLVARLSNDRGNVLLADFLEKSVATIKGEIRNLHHWQQNRCPRFTKLAELVPHWRSSTLNPALSQALTTTVQLGSIISDFGTSTQRAFPAPTDSVLTGICTGSLSAATLSCSGSLSELSWLGVYAVAVAFRVGACAWDAASRISAGDHEDTRVFDSWTAAIHGVNEGEMESAIGQFIEKKDIAPSSSPYISANIGPAQVSISGPGNTLASFLADGLPAGGRVFARLPIPAPYHASNHYDHEDVKSTVDWLRHLNVKWPGNSIPIVSGSDGQLVSLGDFVDVLHRAVEDCLISQIRLDLVPQAIVNHLRGQAASTYTIHSVAAAADRLRSTIENALNAQTDGQLRRLEDAHIGDSRDASTPAPRARAKIAIVGMSGRFPHASSMDAFWEVLKRGEDTHELVPAVRWDARTHVELSPTKNTCGTGFGCWLHDAGLFDSRFFNMSPREAPQVDPAQRLALLTAAEALEQAGIVPGATQSTQKDRVGVYFGCTSNDWMETNSAQNIDTYFIPGGNRAFIPGRINYHFKFSGPSYTIDTACSSSLAAIHMACNALWRGEVDTAIVGGTNVLTNPDMHAGLDRGHFLSRTGNCKTFDESADGYCRGEAVATAILKRLDDAQSDGDNIQACILGIATNHSAEAASITRPHVGAQQQLFQSLLTDVGVSPTEISYVEMHGTGTQAGDAGETESVLDTVAPLTGREARNANQPLFIGAAKSNFGHGESAAGITSLAKVVSMFKHCTIPPHNGIKTKINSKIPDLAPRNAFIAKHPVSWPRPSGKTRRVLLNNFSAAGGNTAMVLEDAPERNAGNSGHDTRSHHLISVSAKTPVSLQANLRNLIEWLAGQDQSNSTLLPLLAYTTTARRTHHPHRVTAWGSNLEAIRQSLEKSLANGEGTNRSASAPGVIFTFTGQGSHFPGMGADLFRQISSFKADIVQYDRLCKKLGLPPIVSLFEDAANYDNATSTSLQLASVALQMALYRWWTSVGVRPKAVVGHSLGEYAALHAAGVLSQADVLYLVGKRAQLMEQHCTPGTHAMLAVRSTLDDIAATLGHPGHDYEVCCVNGHTSIVLGGTQAQIDSARKALTAASVKSTFLKVPWAWHSSQVDPILLSLDKLAHGVRFSTPRIDIISPAHGGILVTGSSVDASFVTRHCRATVNMNEALLKGLQAGLIDQKMLGIEIGPAPVVCKMVRDVLGQQFDSYPTIRREADSWALVNASLSRLYIGGHEINWRILHSDFPACQHMLDLPAYAWDLKDYWLKYTNDWSLRKGEAPLQLPISIESSSIHKVLSDTMNISGGIITAEADLTRKDLHPMVQGHKVYGVPLCTPSVYADIALTFGNRLKSVLNAGKHKLVEVSDMTIQSALVANSEGKTQTLRMEVIMSDKHEALCTFSSVDDKGKILEQHAHCTIRLFDAQARQKALQQTAATIQQQISAVNARANLPGSTYRFSRSMIYKMVGQLADFDPNYRGLVEITLDNDELEAVGRVSFADVVKDGKFHTHPAYIDALSQLGGFVMNANESTDLEKEVFVNHGWHSLQLFEEIRPESTYTTHVKMREGSDKLWTGDITMLCEDRVVGVFMGVALQGVPKRLMHYIVTAADKRVGGVSATNEAKTKRPAVTSAQTMPSVPVSRSAQAAATSIKTVETQAVEIISQESGVAIADLKDDSRFDDFGVDSLLSLVVSSRMRHELALDFQSTLLAELETVGALRAHVRTLAAPSAALDFGLPKRTSSTPAVIARDLEGSTSPPATDETSRSLWESTLEILSAESGLADVDLTDDTAFCDIGIDSLLSLVICSRMRDELGIDISERAFYTDLPTIGALKGHVLGSPSGDQAALGSSSSDTSPTSSSFSDAESQSNTPPSEVTTPIAEAEEIAPTIDTLVRRGLERNDSLFHSSMDPRAPEIKPAWSITLQGSAKKCSRRLFLFPDGCGAATSYLRLPNLDKDTAVIGFNCPFMKTPEAMRGRKLQEVLEAYLQALRKHQAHGPYHLGGWSAGGILAFAAAQELIATGEEVATLLLIDSPDPSHGLDRLPQRFFDHCAKVGIFGSEMTETKTVPPWLVPHFEATIDLLHDYRPPSMPRTAKISSVNIIWAGECALDGVKYAQLPKEHAGDSDTEGMKFLTEKRRDFGPGGWANLFPGTNITVEVAQGEHHFSLMRNDGADRLAAFIRRAMAV